MKRRDFLGCATAGGLTSLVIDSKGMGREAGAWEPRSIVATSLYGQLPLDEILPEVRRTGASHIDLWSKIHGNQREQAETLGEERFANLLRAHDLTLGIVTRFDLGIDRIHEDLGFTRRLGGQALVCHAGGQPGLHGQGLRDAVRAAARRLEPQCGRFAEAGLTLAIENHGKTLLDSRDAILWMADALGGRSAGIALAPYHLPQDPDVLADVIRQLDGRLAHVYAWQHGRGAEPPLAYAEQLLQLPGRGPLDFAPIMAALASIRYRGFVGVFMHPIPRGTPIAPSARAVTEELNRSRDYLNNLPRA